MNPKGGSWAEFVVVAPTLLTRVPRELDLHLAAGIPIAGKTALECLHRLDLGAGQTLFVAGGSGAIGTLVIQMAATRGLRVASSASARNQDYLLALGAELAVDYAAPDWEAQVREWAPGGADAALAIRPGTATPSVSVVREHGHVVTVSGDAFTPARAVRVEPLVHRVDPLEAMRDLVAAVACGELRVFLEWVYQFQDAVKALRKTETGHARGKLVVAV